VDAVEDESVYMIRIGYAATVLRKRLKINPYVISFMERVSNILDKQAYLKNLKTIS